MIKNERQYRITKAEADRFRRTLAELEADGEGNARLHPRLIEAERQALESQLDDLMRDIEDYENLKSGKVSVIRLGSLEDLADGLIQARVACGLSQKALAERLGLKEQQIQRYEAEGYRSASLQRLSEIANAMGLTVREEIEVPGDGRP